MKKPPGRAALLKASAECSEEDAEPDFDSFKEACFFDVYILLILATADTDLNLNGLVLAGNLRLIPLDILFAVELEVDIITFAVLLNGVIALYIILESIDIILEFYSVNNSVKLKSRDEIVFEYVAPEGSVFCAVSVCERSLGF